MLPKEMVGIAMATGASAKRSVAELPKFSSGQLVRSVNINPPTHTRLPRYARGKLGTVVDHRGAFVFADKHAHGHGECPEHVYSVRFESSELWGRDCDGHGAVYLDLWESHICKVEQ